MRKMIMAVTPEQRKAALDILLPYQRSDFEGIFRAMDGTFLFCFFYDFKFFSVFWTSRFRYHLFDVDVGTKLFFLLNVCI